MSTFSTKLSAKVESKLIAAMKAEALIAREIREITNWDGLHMSIKNAVGVVAKRNGLDVAIYEYDDEATGRALNAFCFVAPKEPAKAAASATRRPAKKSAKR